MSGEVDRRIVLGYLADELTWAGQHAGEAYLVLNAGRALRYLRDGAIVSKLDGAATAVDAGAPAEIVARALGVQRGTTADRAPTAPALQFA